MSYDLTNYPLPSNWEQKYDWESKRLFFIDHLNKITTWIDPRIELRKKDLEQQSRSENSTVEDSMAALRIPFNTSKASSSGSNTREKKAIEIQKKYNEFTIAKIIELLKKNYDNEFSVESELHQERRLKIQQEQEEKQKQENEKRMKEEIEKRIKEESEKRIKEESEKRIKEESEKRIKEESEKRIKEESEKRMKEESARRIKEENKNRITEVSLKQKAILNSKVKLKDDTNQAEQKNKSKIDVIIDQNNIETSTGVLNDQESHLFHSDGAQEDKSKFIRGPNKAIYSGPNRNNLVGPNKYLSKKNRENLAKGSNPANYCGPQAGLRL